MFNQQADEQAKKVSESVVAGMQWGAIKFEDRNATKFTIDQSYLTTPQEERRISVKSTPRFDIENSKPEIELTKKL